jgi:hypothetical protein
VKDLALAHQISLYRMERSRSNTLHMQRFRALSKVPGFTGSIKPGISVEKAGSKDRGQMMDISAAVLDETAAEVNLDEEEEDEDQVAEDLAVNLFNVLSISTD